MCISQDPANNIEYLEIACAMLSASEFITDFFSLLFRPQNKLHFTKERNQKLGLPCIFWPRDAEPDLEVGRFYHVTMLGVIHNLVLLPLYDPMTISFRINTTIARPLGFFRGPRWFFRFRQIGKSRSSEILKQIAKHLNLFEVQLYVTVIAKSL